MSTLEFKVLIGTQHKCCLARGGCWQAEDCHKPLQVFACTVGQKPSRAPFYVNDTNEVELLLSRLAKVEGPPVFSPTILMQL